MTYRMDDGALMAIVVVCRMSYVVCRRMSSSSYVARGSESTASRWVWMVFAPPMYHPMPRATTTTTTGLDGVERQNTARGRRATIRDRRRRRAYTGDDCTNVNHVVSAPLENARVNAEGGHETRRASGLSIPRGRCPRCDCSDVNGC